MSSHRASRLVCSVVFTLLVPISPSLQHEPRRIVSLAPSVTEVLFEAGAGARVVGVTSYCRFPAEVRALPKVGGYQTPSYEALVQLAPDLVVVLPEHRDLEPRLAALGLATLQVDHRSISGIIDSIVTIGERAGSVTEARRAADALRLQLQRVRDIGSGRQPPRVLMLFGRSDDLRRVYAAGPGTVHDDLLAHAGGQNVLTSDTVKYPTLSAESVMRIDPEVIVEFAPGAEDARVLRRQWEVLDSLRAVKTNRVHVFTEDFLSVPGPRFVQFAGTLAHALFSK